MSAQHTPGPWALTAEGFGFSVRSAGTMENGYLSEHICSMDHYRDDRAEEQTPNARLIAAAPELLEALQKLCAIADDGDVASWVSEWDAARAAIAKATGELK